MELFQRSIGGYDKSGEAQVIVAGIDINYIFTDKCYKSVMPNKGYNMKPRF